MKKKEEKKGAGTRGARRRRREPGGGPSRRRRREPEARCTSSRRAAAPLRRLARPEVQSSPHLPTAGPPHLPPPGCRAAASSGAARPPPLLGPKLAGASQAIRSRAGKRERRRGKEGSWEENHVGWAHHVGLFCGWSGRPCVGLRPINRKTNTGIALYRMSDRWMVRTSDS